MINNPPLKQSTSAKADTKTEKFILTSLKVRDELIKLINFKFKNKSDNEYHKNLLKIAESDNFDSMLVFLEVRFNAKFSPARNIFGDDK